MSADDRIRVLEKAHEDVVNERDRLRSARAAFTSRLGPLPASAAIVIGLAGSVADKLNPLWIVEAAVLLGLLIVISAVYSGLRPYRLIRAEVQGDGRQLGFDVERSDYEAWLDSKIALEQSIYGPLRRRQKVSLALDVGDLQEAFDVERSAFVGVQLLFAEIIFVLVAGLALSDASFAVQAGVGGLFAFVTLAGLILARRYLGLFKTS